MAALSPPEQMRIHKMQAEQIRAATELMHVHLD
jgi:hypothetical protein